MAGLPGCLNMPVVNAQPEFDKLETPRQACCLTDCYPMAIFLFAASFQGSMDQFEANNFW
uniref:Protein kinase domain-containing protein n=1 Tax=Mesocestoides corti TaxID=53468 RepID=A0A5K3FFZ2_MESCO